MSGRGRRALATALLALALAGGCHPAAIPARPAMWRVQDDDTTIWLLGTIHALPRGVDWRTPVVADAIGQADTLVLELPDDPAATARAFAAVSAASDAPPLADRVPPGRRAALAAAIARAGVASDRVDRLKTWAAAVVIGVGAAEADGAAGSRGVEAGLLADFAARDRPRLGLETAADQFAAFDRLDEAAQGVLLSHMIDGALAEGGYRRTLQAWTHGDSAALTRLTANELAGPPALRDNLLGRRNRVFAAAIAARMARPGRVLVAVGAGHLVGADGVPALLADRGYHVARIE